MIHSLTVLAQVTEGGDAVSGPGGVVVVGFLFVVIVLALLASVTSLMGAWFTKQAARDAAKAADAAQAAAASLADQSSTSGEADDDSTGDEADDPALVAVIAAAVHTMVGDRPHRIVSIRSSGPGWAQEGRRQIFSSHRVR